MPFSAKNLLKGVNVQLQKSTVDKFGSIVDDFSKNAIGKITGTDPNAKPPANRNDPKQWYSTSYAAALAGGSYRPKLKFLFKVEFIFTEEAKREAAKFMKTDSVLRNEFTFMIKSVDRPKIDFEYEEDVNMYNFRTKVLKRIRHQDLTVVFMDDVGNRVFDFFRMMLAIHSPVSRNGYRRDHTFEKPDASALNRSSGMSFLSGGVGDNNAHRAAVNSLFGNSIESIRVKQIFVDPSPGANPLPLASRMVIFDFLNPRVVRFDLDELSHETSDPNLLTMVFDYDWMEMVDVGPLGAENTAYSAGNFSTVLAPNITGAPADITPNKLSGAGESSAGGEGKGQNRIADSIGGVLNRGVRQFTTDVVTKGATAIFGKGKFGRAVGGRLSESVNSAIDGYSKIAGGADQSSVPSSLIGAKARDLVASAGTRISNAFKSPVSDSATAGPDPAVIIRPPSGDY